VEVETGRVKVLKVTAVNDLGTVINRQIVEGQIEGAIMLLPTPAAPESGTCRQLPTRSRRP